MITKPWPHPAVVARNNFIHKSLSCWAYNIAVGCEHACRFCYVPDVSTNRMGSHLAKLGVKDPDAEWGDYVFLRTWDDKAFSRSLRDAEALPTDQLNADGNRAVMLCTTTDPYQTVRVDQTDRNEAIKQTVALQQHRRELVQKALVRILDDSTLNVRILTRSPLARQDFDLMKVFGPRLLFGMSIPTLDNNLARVYEPQAPAPTKRLETLRAAKKAGLNIYVAVAPVYPECTEGDMMRTLKAVKELDPVTIFMEPINIRADNVDRIAAHARYLGVPMKSEVFATPETWGRYAMDQLKHFEGLAQDMNLASRLHLWPDKSLIHRFPNERDWLARQWNKISAWPK